jgi:hypothetical protein
MPGKLRTPWSQRSTTVPATVEEASSVPTGDSSRVANETNADLQHVVEDVEHFSKSHQWDPNLPQEKLDILHDAAKTGDPEEVKEVEAEFAEDSPYEEVRAAVSNTDDGSVANTVRAWILGMIFVTLGSGLNMFLSMRQANLLPPQSIAMLTYRH